MIDEKQKEQILLGRKAIDKYREDHLKLYETIIISKIPEAHTPLLDIAKSAITNSQIDSLGKLFELSYLLNLQELGYESIEDFEKNGTKEDIEKLNQMWH